MKAVFQDVIGNKVTIEVPQDKQLNELKNEIMANFKVNPKKKEVQIFYHNQKLENNSTLASIKYKEGDVLSVMFKKITEVKAQRKEEPKPESENQPSQNLQPSQKKEEPKTEQVHQASTNSQLPPQQPQTPPNPTSPLRLAPQPTDTGLPSRGQRAVVSNMEPYPQTVPSKDEVGRINCLKIRDIMVRSSPDLVLHALQAINPELYERVQANPDPFLRMFGVHQAPGYVHEMIQNIGQTVSQYTPQERESIQRLVNMGYEVDLVVQIFEAADRDEQRAAMILSGL